MTTVYFAGGEDSEFAQVGGGVVSTTSGNFRSAYARCALTVAGASGGAINTYWVNSVEFVGTPTSLWLSARVVQINDSAASSGWSLFDLVDNASLPRLRVRATSSGFPLTMGVFKVNTAGTETQLGSTFVLQPSGVTIPDKIDLQFVNAVSGTINIYFNGVNKFTYSGDTTTETTGIGYVRLGTCQDSNSTGWSEVIVVDTDTRNMSLQTLAPVANGNTHDWDVGSPQASNVNEIVVNDATLDGSTIAGQIDEYTIPSIASGTFSIIAVGISARTTRGTTGPTKYDFVVRQSGADYTSADQSPGTAWGQEQNWWVVDPSTSAPWVTLPVNIGLESVA